MQASVYTSHKHVTYMINAYCCIFRSVSSCVRFLWSFSSCSALDVSCREWSLSENDECNPKDFFIIEWAQKICQWTASSEKLRKSTDKWFKNDRKKVNRHRKRTWCISQELFRTSRSAGIRECAAACPHSWLSWKNSKYLQFIPLIKIFKLKISFKFYTT